MNKNHQITLWIWLALITLTLITGSVTELFSHLSPTAVALMIMTAVWLKAALITHYYMELMHASRLVYGLFQGWCLIVSLIFTVAWVS